VHPDADGGATKTDPLNEDTDGGGVIDGAEDANHNGQVDDGEIDPTTSATGRTTCRWSDTDGDGLTDDRGAPSARIRTTPTATTTA
jgi:hypothetical protein